MTIFSLSVHPGWCVLMWKVLEGHEHLKKNCGWEKGPNGNSCPTHSETVGKPVFKKYTPGKV